MTTDRRGSPSLRPAHAADRSRILELFAAQDVAWWGRAEMEADELEQHVALIRRAAGSLSDGGRVGVVDDTVVGFAALVGRGRTIFAVEPGHEATRAALFDWLFEAGADEIEIPAQDEPLRAEATRLGLVHDGSSFELERALPLDDLPVPSFPDGVEVVEWDDALAPAVHAAIYSVWSDVPGHAERGYDEWRELFVDYDSFEPPVNLILRRGHEVVGAAMCRFYPGPFGWVSQLAIGSGHQGRGLGRSLLVTALRRLARRDAVTAVGLGVEAVNRSALGLYRSVGLEIDREWQHWAAPRAATGAAR